MSSNGIGPKWFPAPLRKALTKLGEYFFIEASWEIHDEGYTKGSPDRDVCDRKFLQAMLRDASLTTTTLKVAGCTILAWTFWLFTRVFGWMTYRNKVVSIKSQGDL
jgi:hypothetical protein